MNERLVSAGRYLAQVVAARNLYRLLYEEALANAGDGTEAALESMRPYAQVGRELLVSATTVRQDLAVLERLQWVRVEGVRLRLLGHRRAGCVYLLADEAAERQTGQRILVSRVVLEGLWRPAEAPPILPSQAFPAPGTPLAPAPTPRVLGGALREWRAREGEA